MRPQWRAWRDRTMMRMRLPIIPGAACPLLIALLFLSACKDEKNTYVPPPPAAVGVAKPLQQQVVPYLEATGNTVAFNSVDLVARIQGFLTSINYVDGANAKQGDTLFIVEPDPYQAKLQQSQA